MFRALNNADGILHLPKDFADRLVAECRQQPKKAFFPSLPRWALIAASLAIVAGFVFAAVEAFEALSAPEDVARDESPRTSPIDDQLPATNNQPPTNQLPTNQPPTNQLPTNQLPTNQGETTMIPKKAVKAALAATMAAAPLAATSGDGYQFILSGDPVAASTAGSSSASSATASLTSGTLADGFVLANELEARSRTFGESGLSALRSDDFTSTMIILR